MQRESCNKLMIAFLMILCLGIGIGSIYMMRANNEEFWHIKEYLNSFFRMIGDLNKRQVFRNSLYDNIILATVIFICGFFRHGIVGVAVCIAKKGFVMGFTSASMLKCFGIKGLLINIAYLPSILISLPMLVFFSVGSAAVSQNNTNIRKKLLMRYIFFAIITITIFSIASFLEAYLTTTFMKLLTPTNF